ncbi:MAG: alpha-ketoglutarate-dependent dioxygenase AlkB [Flavobacteriales bacterium]|nr:alpha-ketoglutarate-dependent dioxygenase AlkB [Flavobacteriales bacterium]
MRKNLLPYDGRVIYRPGIIDVPRSKEYFNNLLTQIEWKSDEGVIFGKHYKTKRKVAWYGDEGFNYAYSNKKRLALPWTSELKEIKQMVESVCSYTFNSCLLNLYHNGAEGMGWHSDNERTMLSGAPIVSLSLGAPRTFKFKHKKSNESISILLETGSLLTMEGNTQDHWKHCLPTSKKISDARINLTFRQYTE